MKKPKFLEKDHPLRDVIVPILLFAVVTIGVGLLLTKVIVKLF